MSTETPIIEVRSGEKIDQGNTGVTADENQPRNKGGAPKGNQNAKKHTLPAARRALKEFGLRAIDGRSTVGVAIREFRTDITADLGGIDVLSVQEKTIVDILIREKLMLDSIDAWILDRPSLINSK